MVVRLVGEDAGHAAAELVAEFLAVSFVGNLYELPHGFVAHRVEVGEPVVPRTRSGDLDAEDDDRLAAGQSRRSLAARQAADLEGPLAANEGRVGRQHVLGPFEIAGLFVPLDQHPLLAVPRIARHQSPRSAGRPAVLVVKPGLHVELFGLVDAGGHTLHPLVAQVRRVQPHATVHEEAAKPHAVHDANLAAKFLGFQATVPGPERRAAVLARGAVEFGKKRLVHFASSLSAPRFVAARLPGQADSHHHHASKAHNVQGVTGRLARQNKRATLWTAHVLSSCQPPTSTT